MNGYSNKLQQEIILKLCRPNYSVKKEATMLKKYSGISCQCFYYDEIDRVLILEKLYPGDDINKILKRKDRIKYFSDIMKQTVLEIDNENHPIYAERLKRDFSSAIENKDKYGETAKLVPIAYQYFQEMQDLHLKKCLLHGDLGSGNIIKAETYGKSLTLKV